MHCASNHVNKMLNFRQSTKRLIIAGMNWKIPPLLNEDGSAYHLGLCPNDLPALLFTVGDPQRVAAVSAFFDHVSTKKSKREFVFHRGNLKGQDVGVISTGMGTANIEIFMVELFGLMNGQSEPRPTKIVRLGTTGAIQKNIALESILSNSAAIACDGLASFYPFAGSKLTQNFKEALTQNHTIGPCYSGKHDQGLAKQLASNFQEGLCYTAAGFYAPQGRGDFHKHLLADLQQFRFEGQSITNIEMETAALFAFANAMNIPCISLSVVLANRALNTFSKNPQAATEKFLADVLNKVSA